MRKKITACQTYHDPLLEKLKEWREKYEKAEKEITRLKEKNRQLEKEKENLLQEIEKLTKSQNRYQVALFDHGNFKNPHQGDKKPNGGQKGHADTNKDGKRNYQSFARQRLFACILSRIV